MHQCNEILNIKKLMKALDAIARQIKDRQNPRRLYCYDCGGDSQAGDGITLI